MTVSKAGYSASDNDKNIVFKSICGELELPPKIM